MATDQVGPLEQDHNMPQKFLGDLLPLSDLFDLDGPAGLPGSDKLRHSQDTVKTFRTDLHLPLVYPY
jgi:hypothetical protein